MRRPALLAIALFIALSSSSYAQSYDDVVASLAAKSPFIFLGTAGSGMAVHVELIFRGADTIGAFTNQDVLIVRPPNAQRQRAIFFVTPIEYAKLMMAHEDGELAAPDDPQTFADSLARADRAASDRQLLDRLQSAEAVVVARVVRTSDLTATRHAWEHDPWWSLAVLELVRTLKSEPRTSNVLFAGSVDIRWFQAPKLRPGDEAIFLLRRDTGKPLKPGEAPDINAYILINDQDVRPLSDEQRIITLLGGPR